MTPTLEVLDMILKQLRRHNGWCQNHEAETKAGQPCHCDDPAAARYDICGACALLFGVENAFTLYVWLAQIVTARGERGSAGDWATQHEAFKRLCDFNDSPKRTVVDITRPIKTCRDTLAWWRAYAPTPKSPLTK